MRKTNRLTAVQVKRLRKPGLYADGGNLYLQIADGGSRSWIFRFARRGRTRDMGLGSTSTLTLLEARQRATEARRSVLDGIDPIEARRASRAVAVAVKTLRQSADEFIIAHAPGWRGSGSEAQWRSSLESYAYPQIGDLPVGDIETANVLRVLAPIWSTRTVTAGRVRGRIESILDAARASGLRSGENPARWRGHLENLLPKPKKVARIEHHKAMDHRAVAGFVSNLRTRIGAPARALEFCVLTASRRGETLGATWNEIEHAGRVWTIPPTRTKAGREHKIPLADRALEILAEQAAVRGDSDFIFPGRRDRPLGKGSLTDTLRGMNAGVTAHGFRATFALVQRADEFSGRSPRAGARACGRQRG
jgi:integrase